MKKLSTHFLATCLLAFICTLTAQAHKYMILYNEDSGFRRTYTLTEDGRPDVKVDEKYMSNRFTRWENIQRTSSGKQTGILCLSGDKTNQRVAVYQMNQNGSFGNRVYHSKSWNLVIPFRRSTGSTVFFMVNRRDNESTNTFQTCRESTDLGPGLRIDKGVLPKADDYQIFQAGGKRYLLMYFQKEGKGEIRELIKDGYLADSGKQFNLPKNMTSIDTYRMKVANIDRNGHTHKTFCILIREKDGHPEIRKFQNGSLEQIVETKTFSPGWDMSVPFSSDGAKLFFRNRRDNRVLIRAIKSDGTLGKVTFETNNWRRGWTSFTTFRTSSSRLPSKKNCYPSAVRDLGQKPPTKKASIIVFYNNDSAFDQLMQQSFVREQDGF
ncbi:MAG: hypothetical protein AAFV80_19450 [Bacteroidota bacterium]